MKNRSLGFTLIELIVVMTIILILAGLITGAAMKAKQRAMVAQTKAMISGLEMAINMYYQDVGSYPEDGGWPYSGKPDLVTRLITGGSPPPAGWSGPYMQFKSTDIVSGCVVDPWGSYYVYRNPGLVHQAGADHSNYIDSYSTGPDKITQSWSAGQPPQADDICNW